MPDTARDTGSGAFAGRAPDGALPRFRAEFRDFLNFVRRPELTRRLPRRATGAWRAEWLGGIAPARLACWVLALWSINLLVLGPLAAIVAGITGAVHNRLPTDLPWFRALLWAPIVEEMLLRFGLRRPALALWLMPILVAGLVLATEPVGAALTCLAAAGVAGVMISQGYRWPRPRLRRYREIFPIVFHLATLTFALLHLANFRLGGALLWLLPLLVLPQWATGLVLGWLRVRYGIGASILLHGLFNAGPMLLIWLLLRYAPGMLEG